MKVNSKAPLRISFAGGGTDISLFSSRYSGSVLNSTIDLSTYCTIEALKEEKIIFKSLDFNQTYSCKSKKYLELDKEFILFKAIYNKMVELFNNKKELNVKITTYSDAPPGSGLGSSSSMVVAILKAFQLFLKISISKRRIAQLAYEIERLDCQISGGSQDQYSAAYGGFNYMSFLKDGSVKIESLKMSRVLINELESNILLYFTGISRRSGKIIDQQKRMIVNKNGKTIEALKNIKILTVLMKKALLQGNIKKMSLLLEKAWSQKKKTSSLIENKIIRKIHKFVLANGANAAKISGAGGGGYMMIFVKPEKKFYLKNKLKKFNKHGQVYDFHFTSHGAENWISNNR